MQGRASDALAMVFSRAIAALRAAATMLMIFFVVAWWPWYGARPTALAAVAVAAAWSLIFIVTCLAHGVTTWLAIVNVAVAGTFGLTSRYCLPPETVGDGGNWVFLANLNAGVVAGWVFGRAWFAAAIALLACAHYGGAYWALPQAASATILIVAVSILFRLAASRLHRVATGADKQLCEAAAHQRADAIAAERARDRRERDRLIHDTVLNTLTGIGWGGGQDIGLVRRRCERSIFAVESLLTAEEHATAATGNLAERLHSAVDTARAGGLDIHVRFPDQHGCPSRHECADRHGSGEQPRQPRQPRRHARRHRVNRRGHPAMAAQVAAERRKRSGDGDGALLTGLPPDVVTAFARATGESLTNVALHSGTDHAEVELLTAGAGETVEVVIRDDGAGFDVASPDPRRLGLRGSVEGRMADVGGWVIIDSEQGRGTTVRLLWRRFGSADDAGGVRGVRGVRGGRGGRGVRGVVGTPRPTATSTAYSYPAYPAYSAARTAAELRRASDSAIRRVVGILAVSWQAVLFIALVASLGRVRSPVAAVAIWVATSAGIAMAGWVTRRRPLRRTEAAALLGVVLAAILAGVFNAQGLDVVRYPNWPAVVPHAAMVIIILSRPPREWLPACVTASAAMVTLPIVVAGADPIVLTRAAMYTYIMWTSAVIFATLGPVWSSGAEATARAAEAEATLGARQEAAAMIRRDRARGLHMIEGNLLPLLRLIMNAELDPRDPAVREQCSHQAAILRRRLQQGEAPSSLGAVEQIEQAVEAAEDRGVDVEIQLAGDFRYTPASLREEIAGWVRAALDGLRGGRATLTALCGEGCGSMVLSFPAPTENRLTSPSATTGPGTATTPRYAGAVPATGPDAALGAVPGAVLLPPSLDVRTEVEDGRAFLEMRWGTSAAPA